MNSVTLICTWILVLPIGIIEDSTLRKWSFWLYFSSLQDYWPSSTWNFFSKYLVERNGALWNTWFSAPQNAKKENQLKHKNQVRNRFFIDSEVFEYEELYLSLRGEHIKDNVCINFNKSNENFEIFFNRSRVLNAKKSFPICMFVVMNSGKCEFHIYFTFLQEF
jgi:hypothetical protein